VTPDIAEAIRLHALVIGELADEYLTLGFEGPEAYAGLHELTKPHGTTWTQWGEEQSAVLASDITVRCEALLRLVEPGRVA
jgi:hypothetical protein